MLNILLILVLVIHSLPFRAFGVSCTEARGIQQGADCYCELTKIFVDPQVQTCPENILTWLNSFEKKSNCSMIGKSSPATVNLNPSELCNNPDSICDVSRNPKLRELITQENLALNSQLKVDEDPELRAFLSSVPKFSAWGPKSCATMLGELTQIDKCYELKNKAIDRLLPKRKVTLAKIEEEFSFCKKSAVNEMDKKIDSMANADPKTIESLRAGRQRILDTKLSIKFGNAMDLTYSRKGEMTVYGLASISPFPVESFRFQCLHELGHAADSNFVEFSEAFDNQKELKPYNALESGFNDTYECLNTFTQGVDRKCLEEARNQKVKGSPLKTIENSIYLPYVGNYQDQDERPCKNSMMFEAFADNFAREAYFALAGAKPSLDSLTEATLLMCEDILIRRSKPYLEGRDFDDHPSGQNRLKMFFSHPLIEKLSGCKSNYKTEKGYVLRCQ